MMKEKAAAYCRISTDRDQQLNSLTNQKNFFQQYITAHPQWELTEIFYDEGVSGTSTQKRTGFRRMMAGAEQGDFSILLIKEVSRFSRNTLDTLAYLRQLKAMGIRVIFTGENIDTAEEDGELRLALMGIIAQEESRKISSRVKWGQKRSMERGIVFGTREMTGYRVQNKAEMAIIPQEAALVRRIFHLYTEEKLSFGAIAQRLTELREPPPQGEQWHPSTIWRILHNEKYVGDLCQGKTCTPNFLDHRRCSRNSEEQTLIPHHHPAIISQELWEKAQEEHARRKAAPKSQSAAHPYGGKIFCRQCGMPMQRRCDKRKDGTLSMLWRCPQGHGSVNHKVLYRCGELLRNCMALSVSELHQGLKRRLNLCNKAADSRHHQKERLIDLYISGLITKEELAARQNKLKAESRPQEITIRPEQIQEELESALSMMIRRVEYEKNTLQFYFQHPALRGYEFSYRTQGRGKNYQVSIDTMKPLDSGVFSLRQ